MILFDPVFDPDLDIDVVSFRTRQGSDNRCYFVYCCVREARFVFLHGTRNVSIIRT